jgi:hypothetical protein
MAAQPTDNALAARRILRSDALPAIEKRLKTRPRFIDEVADVAATDTLSIVRPAKMDSGGWGLVRAGIGIVSNVATIVPPPDQGGPKPSFTGGVLLGAMVAAVAGDRMLHSAEIPGPGDAQKPHAQEPYDDAVRLAEELLDPIATPESRRRFADHLITQLDEDVPGIDHALAGATLRTLGVWLASSSSHVAAPIANSGVLRRRRNDAPAGCGFAGALIAQIGLALGQARLAG